MLWTKTPEIIFLEACMIRRSRTPTETAKKRSYCPYTLKLSSELQKFLQQYMGNNFHNSFLEKSLQLLQRVLFTQKKAT